MTSDLRIAIGQEHGRAIIQLLRNSEIVGVVNVPWYEYADLVRKIIGTVRVSAQESIAKELGDILWRDACSVAEGGSTELAKKLLTDFNWNQAKIEAYASELSKRIAQLLVTKLPEHR